MKDEHLREKIIEIIGFGMERERAECKTDEILALIEEQESKPLMTAEEIVNGNFGGLYNLINDEDLCQWYKDLIKTCLEEYANQFKTK